MSVKAYKKNGPLHERASRRDPHEIVAILMRSP